MDNGLALSPPMGWYELFGVQIGQHSVCPRAGVVGCLGVGHEINAASGALRLDGSRGQQIVTPIAVVHRARPALAILLDLLLCPNDQGMETSRRHCIEFVGVTNPEHERGKVPSGQN